MNIWDHPAFWAVFQAEVILRNIFSFCDIKDLESIRLVCKKWFRESLSFYRSRKVISLALKHPAELLQDNRDKENRNFSWENFKELLENDGDDFLQLWTTPYSNFKLYTVKDDELQNSDDGDDGDWLRWNRRSNLLPSVIPAITLDIFGTVIRTLHLDFSELYFGGSQRLFDEAVVNLIFFRAPNLKQLFIKEWPGARRNSYPTVSLPVQRHLKVLGVHGNIPFAWEDILSAFPGLQKLHLVEMKNHEYTVPSLFLAFRSRSGSDANNLLDLDLTVNCDKYCSAWSDDPYYLYVPPTLKNFKLHLDGELRWSAILSSRSILHWLSTNPQPVFKTLCISNLVCPTESVLPRLNTGGQSTLAFLEEFVALDRNYITDFHFLSHMPNLRKLVIKDVSLDKWRCTEATHKYSDVCASVIRRPNCLLGGTMLPFLKEFHFEARLNARSLQSLSGAAPNLRSIASVFTDETFRIICKYFPSIQHLKILAGSKLSDEGLIGGQVDAFDLSYSTFPNLTETESSEGIFGWQLYPHRFPVFPNIRNLNDLRTFTYERSINDYEGCRRFRDDHYYYPYCHHGYYGNDDCDDDCGRGYIELGDAFVQYGLLNLPFLQIVRIEPISNISYKAEEALRNKILSVDIYRKPLLSSDPCTKVGRCRRCADHYFWDVLEFRAKRKKIRYFFEQSYFDGLELDDIVDYDKEDQLSQKILRKRKKWSRSSYGSVISDNYELTRSNTYNLSSDINLRKYKRIVEPFWYYLYVTKYHNQYFQYFFY